MADRGYIRLYRGWRQSDAFKDEPCSEREAWVWLLEEAAYKPRRRDVNGTTITLQRGQAALSSRFLAKAWRWEEPRVRRFLKRLEQHGMISVERTRPVNVLTVANYDAYQANGTKRETDAPSDASSDAGYDVGSDARNTAETQGTQPDTDAGSDAGSDAPSDAPTDANENKGALRKDSNRGGRATRLPEDWQPKLKHYELGRKLGLQASEVDYEADKFCDHFFSASGQNARKRDWDRAFNNWLRKAAEYGKRAPTGKPPQGHRQGPGSAVAAYGDLVSGSGG